jgi:broad specificity phosphatase PhoE
MNDLETLLQPYSENDKISLLIRHSNRYDIQSDTNGIDVLLTEEGKINASHLGEKLSKYRINKIITTPVKRCIETAEYIAKGYGKNIQITPSDTFGSLHITNWQLANEFFNTRGYEKWYRNIVADTPTQGICNSNQYKQLMTNFIVENTDSTGITIFVSHDFLIAFYHYALNRTIYTMFSDWVNYLSGLIFKNGQTEYVARFQNNK